jgi:hypothetical protein
MSGFEFRASVPADAPALEALCGRALGTSDASPMFEAALMNWKYWRPWPTWSGDRSYVITRGGEVLAHVAAIPVTYQRAGVAHTLLHPLDWAARSDVIGAGAMVLQRLSRVADGLLVVGGSSMTQRMVGPLGFRTLPAVHRYAARPVAEADRGVEVRAMADGEAPPSMEEAFAPALTAVRTPCLMALWRACPALRVQGFLVRAGGQPSGGFVLSVAPGQARLVDVWCASAQPEAWAPVLSAARFEAGRFAGVAEVATLANTPLEQQALLAAGFKQRGSVPMFIQSRALPRLAEGGLRFQMLDGDAAFLHHGVTESWLGN